MEQLLVNTLTAISATVQYVPPGPDYGALVVKILGLGLSTGIIAAGLSALKKKR